MNLGLVGKRVVVTGAGSGIGRVVASAFATEGAQVCCVGRTMSKLDETLLNLPSVDGGHLAQSVDLRLGLAVEKFANELLETWKGVDVVIHNACGIASRRRLPDIEGDAWDEFVGGELRAAFRLMKHFLPGMATDGWGRFVNVGSLSANLGASHYGDYATVKAGLIGMTRTAAVEWGKKGITCNLVRPGFIRTKRFEKAAPDHLVSTFAKSTSVKRIGEPEEVADLILFLASERASYITGAVIDVGGGAGLNNLW